MLIILGEYAEVNIDNLLIEADKLINETKPYFQTISNNKGEIPKDLKSKNINFTIKTTQSKYQQSDKKRVVFNLKNSPHNVTISKKHFKTSKINGIITYTYLPYRFKLYIFGNTFSANTTLVVKM